jgi:hypothetical protein
LSRFSLCKATGESSYKSSLVPSKVVPVYGTRLSVSIFLVSPLNPIPVMMYVMIENYGNLSIRSRLSISIYPWLLSRTTLRTQHIPQLQVAALHHTQLLYRTSSSAHPAVQGAGHSPDEHPAKHLRLVPPRPHQGHVRSRWRRLQRSSVPSHKFPL